MGHSGVLRMAWEVEPLLEPWLASALQGGTKVVLSGYSLGGSLAQVGAPAAAAGRRPPAASRYGRRPKYLPYVAVCGGA